MFSPRVEIQLGRLADAAMVWARNGIWRARPLSTIFAANHIISIEAKVGDWRTALQQAYLNSWFASDSCILLPHIPRDSGVVAYAAELGIKVLIKETDDQGIRPEKPVRPRSYLSWLFNDWAWRAAVSF